MYKKLNKIIEKIFVFIYNKPRTQSIFRKITVFYFLAETKKYMYEYISTLFGKNI